MVLCFWALAMTFLIGPGYCRQVFKSVCLDPIAQIGADDVSQPGDNEDGDAAGDKDGEAVAIGSINENDGAAGPATQKSGSGNSGNPNDADYVEEAPA